MVDVWSLCNPVALASVIWCSLHPEHACAHCESQDASRIPGQKGSQKVSVVLASLLAVRWPGSGVWYTGMYTAAQPLSFSLSR